MRALVFGFHSQVFLLHPKVSSDFCACGIMRSVVLNCTECVIISKACILVHLGFDFGAIGSTGTGVFLNIYTSGPFLG